jgi:epoxyqueuosine reductase
MENQLLKLLDVCFTNSELNRLPKEYGGERIFSTPLIGVASGDDPMYLRYKEVVGPEHLTPSEMWKICGQEEIENDKLRVLSIVFPYSSKIRKEAKNFVKLHNLTIPSEYYSIGRNYANEFKVYIMKQCVNFFEEKGFNAVAGMLSKAYTIIMRGTFYSTWSERHTAFVAGLGTFSLHEGFITEIGCNVRLASVITNAPLKITPRKSDNPYSNCLFFTKGTCKACIEKCPAEAITVEGHNKLKCSYYGQKIAIKMRNRIGSFLKPHVRTINGIQRPPTLPVGCAFCQFGVPCMDKNPTA